MKVDVDPADYQSAAEIFGTYFCDEVAACGDTLALEASLIGKVSGNDPTGVAFGQSYDDSAPAVLQAIFDLSDAGMQTAALLEQSGFNVAMADAYSDITGRSLPEPQASYVVDGGRIANLASASGGGIRDLPDGWEIVQAVLTLGYPDGDTDKLRQLGRAWQRAASTLEGSGDTVVSGVLALENVASPEIDDAVLVCESLGNIAAETAAHARNIGQSCLDFADQIEETRNKIVYELGIMIATIVALEIAAGLAAGPTAGVGTAALQVAVAARVATTGQKIMAFLEWLLLASSLTRGRLIWYSRAAVETGLKSILGKLPKKPGLTPAVPITTLDETAKAIVDSSPWLLAPFPRGLAIEKIVATDLLPPGFPRVDVWNPSAGIVTSIKSIDLGATTYQSMARLKSLLNGYVRKLDEFNGAAFNGARIRPGDIKDKVLHVVIPEGASAEQLAILKEVAAKAAEKDIEVIWLVVP